MFVQEFIENALPYTLSAQSSAGEAIRIMESLHIRHMIITEGDQFKGLLADEALYDAKPDAKIDALTEEHPHLLHWANANDHLFSVIENLSKHNVTVLPVLENGVLIGALTLDHVFKIMAKFLSSEEHGNVFLIELGESQGSLSEVIRVLEQEQVKVFSAIVTYLPEDSKEFYTIKTAALATQPIILSLERYGYEVLATNEDGNVSSLWMDRYESFMNYLNV